LAPANCLRRSTHSPTVQWSYRIGYGHCHDEYPQTEETRAKDGVVFQTLAALATIPILGCLWKLWQHADAVAPSNDVQLKWAIAQLTVILAVAAFFSFIAHTLWNYANVWLGREGTLEDLTLAIQMAGADPDCPTLFKAESQNLLHIVESLSRLRRSFEGDLLKGPSFDFPRFSR
jgi:hypothetical protein